MSVCLSVCMRVSACVHAGMQECMCECIHACMGMCVRVCVRPCACMYARMRVFVHAYTYAHTYECACRHACACECVGRHRPLLPAPDLVTMHRRRNPKHFHRPAGEKTVQLLPSLVPANGQTLPVVRLDAAARLQRDVISRPDVARVADADEGLGVRDVKERERRLDLSIGC